jgi:hypothetical protein
MMRSVAWITALILGAGAVADAQPRRGGRELVAQRRAGPAERRDQIKKKIRALRAYTLTEELALDEPTASRLFPALARYDDETDRLLEKRLDVQRRLRRADAIKDARAIDRLIDEAIANQHGFWELEDRRLADLRKILTPAQAAKLLVVLPALERKIENQLRRAIVQRRGAAAAGRASGGPDDPDDDEQADERGMPGRPPPRREAPLAPRAPSPNAPGNTPPCDPNAGPCR